MKNSQQHNIITYNTKYKNSLIGHLGILFHESELGTVIASMPVTSHTSQPVGYLSGGASLALAESIAGHGSYLLCLENEFPCGIQVSGNHIKSVPIGKLVKGKGQIIHKGNTTHLWHIDIINEEEEIVSTARVVNHIIKNKSNKG